MKGSTQHSLSNHLNQSVFNISTHKRNSFCESLLWRARKSGLLGLYLQAANLEFILSIKTYCGDRVGATLICI